MDMAACVKAPSAFASFYAHLNCECPNKGWESFFKLRYTHKGNPSQTRKVHVSFPVSLNTFKGMINVVKNSYVLISSTKSKADVFHTMTIHSIHGWQNLKKTKKQSTNIAASSDYRGSSALTPFSTCVKSFV